ncbi:RNA polymerase subunit sigma [Bradyrhizobium arachidis]|uniref:RNA polymerase sigma factor n=1 Tax=Bradyrhizobium arachidis TaxID=858423 RepID=A0AAE7NI45_9BRAD|nr:RNA polymerase subunit sigma [Bradyrhizobium arachidis]
MNPDQTARFRTLVVPHLADALAFARWITRDRADAEDVVQEACIRAFRSLDRFAGSNAKAWLLTIVRNTAFTWLNDKRRLSLVRLDDLSDQERLEVEQGEAREDDISPEAAIIAVGESALLDRHISELPMGFRVVLVLRDIQGLEYREISDVMGLPLGTVMSRLARARQRLIAQIRRERSS